jgi:hypothetical protein
VKQGEEGNVCPSPQERVVRRVVEKPRKGLMGLGHFSAGVRVVDCVMLTIDAVAATAVGGYAGKVGCTAAGAVFTGVGTVAAVAIVTISLGQRVVGV